MSMTKPQPAAPKPKLRWFQFSLRSMLIFVTLCAIVCSWIATKMQNVKQQWEQLKPQREALRRIEHAGGLLSVELSEPPLDWLQSLFVDGPYGVTSVDWKGPKVTDAGLENLEGLSRLRKLRLCGANITDSGLESLHGLKQLQEVHLLCPQVTAGGVKQLQEALPNCKILWTPPAGSTSSPPLE